MQFNCYVIFKESSRCRYEGQVMKYLGGARARHVWPSHKMQRTFLNWRKPVDLVSVRALINQARYKYHQSKLIPSHQVRNTFLLFGSAQFLGFWLSKLV